MEVDTHLGCTMSGLTADTRTTIDHAPVTTQNHNFTYDEKIEAERATWAMCDLTLRVKVGVRKRGGYAHLRHKLAK